MCVICFNPRDGVYAFNCNHAVTCKNCAEEILKRGFDQNEEAKCPMCRKKVDKITQIFM